MFISFVINVFHFYSVFILIITYAKKGMVYVALVCLFADYLCEGSYVFIGIYLFIYLFIC